MTDLDLTPRDMLLAQLEHAEHELGQVEMGRAQLVSSLGTAFARGYWTGRASGIRSALILLDDEGVPIDD